MGTEAWYVLHSKPHKERQLDAYLQSQGIETFLPVIRVKPVNPRASKINPLFPGYLFVRADLEKVGQSRLQWVPGAIRLVAFDGYPAAVPDHTIQHLKCHVKEINYAAKHHLDDIRRGDPVRIVEGPLAGYEAIFDMRLSGSERVQVLLDLLGRQIRTHVNARAIEKRRNQ
jgi:transcription elongation factor/antiterminator RfaH